MSIIKNNNEVVRVFKGTLPLSYIYKGDKLIWQLEEVITEDPYADYGIVLEWNTRNDLSYSSSGTRLYGEIALIYDKVNSRIKYFSFKDFLEDEPSTISKCNVSDLPQLNMAEFKTYSSNGSIVGTNNTLKKVLKFPNLDRTFSFNCPNLEYVNWKGVPLQYLILNNKCTSLTEIDCDTVNERGNMSFAYSPLSNKTIVRIFNILKENNGINNLITLSNTSYDTLTQGQLAIATSKGWTVTT